MDIGLSSVKGFSFSAIKCGIRYEGKLDLCLILSEKPCNASGLFTTNKVFAAPVKLCRERITNKINGILVNSTNANACTGDEGYFNAEKLTAIVGESVGVKGETILMASTGIIGRQLPFEKISSAIPDLISSLSPLSGSTIAQAIMTTDTKPKEYGCEFKTSRGTFTIAGVAKGSGMIAPNMGTMLSFIITDAPIRKNDLDRSFKDTVNKTFNAITIDGDMSTNDSAVILSPASEKYLESEADIAAFESALFRTCRELSRLLVDDAEGGTKLVTINVSGAKNDSDAKSAAKSIAQSMLVKTAFFGCDPNWGRIACAAGYSGASFQMTDLSVAIDDSILLKNGEPVSCDITQISSVMKKTRIYRFCFSR